MFYLCMVNKEKLCGELFLCLLRKKRQSLLQRKKKKLACARNWMQGRKKKKRKQSFQKKKKEKKNKSGIVYIVYVGVAQSLDATSCYSLFYLTFCCSS